MTEQIQIMSVTADPTTGEWIGSPKATGETTTFSDWAKREDTDIVHYDTHIAWQNGDEITTAKPGHFAEEDGWKETEVAIMVEWR